MGIRVAILQQIADALTVLADGNPFSVGNGNTSISITDTDTTYALVGIKLKPAFSDCKIKIHSVSVVRTEANNNLLLWTLISKPDVAGEWEYSSLGPQSCVDFAVGVAANTVTNGKVKRSGYVRDDQPIQIEMGVMDGPATELVLCVQPVTAAATVYGTLNFDEIPA